MSSVDPALEHEVDKVRIEREFYPTGVLDTTKRIFDYVAFMFLVSGFIALGLLFFTDITLLQATCLFVISYVIAPTDGDRYEVQIKGMAEDLANVRVNTTVIWKHLRGKI